MEEMLLYQVREEIEAPAEEIFSYLWDDDKIAIWNSLFVENIYESEEDKVNL